MGYGVGGRANAMCELEAMWEFPKIGGTEYGPQPSHKDPQRGGPPFIETLTCSRTASCIAMNSMRAPQTADQANYATMGLSYT